MSRVLQATKDKIDGYENAGRIKVVKLPEYIVLGRPLPMPLDKDKTFLFLHEEYSFDGDDAVPGDESLTGFFVASESGFFGDNTVMQGSYDIETLTGQHPPNLNDYVTVHAN